MSSLFSSVAFVLDELNRSKAATLGIMICDVLWISLSNRIWIF